MTFIIHDSNNSIVKLVNFYKTEEFNSKPFDIKIYKFNPKTIAPPLAKIVLPVMGINFEGKHYLSTIFYSDFYLDFNEFKKEYMEYEDDYVDVLSYYNIKLIETEVGVKNPCSKDVENSFITHALRFSKFQLEHFYEVDKIPNPSYKNL